MTLSLMGWIIMSLSVGGVTGFLGWCIWKVLKDPQASEDIHAPLDADIDQDGDHLA